MIRLTIVKKKYDTRIDTICKNNLKCNYNSNTESLKQKLKDTN